jgi:hypothetical protein
MGEVVEGPEMDEAQKHPRAGRLRESWAENKEE